jgi:predicted RNase H-like nuclease (RuvC/YqgF family)
MRSSQGDISFPGKRWRQQSKESGQQITSAILTPSELPKEKTTNEISEAILNDWTRNLPNWTSEDINSEIEKLENQSVNNSGNISSLDVKVANLEQSAIEAQKQILEMQKEIESLKLQVPQKIEEDIWEMNKKEITKMEKLFNLSPISNEPIEQQLVKMRGYLKEYSEADLDPVDLLHAMRNHE